MEKLQPNINQFFKPKQPTQENSQKVQAKIEDKLSVEKSEGIELPLSTRPDAMGSLNPLSGTRNPDQINNTSGHLPCVEDYPHIIRESLL